MNIEDCIAELARVCYRINKLTEKAVWFNIEGHVNWAEVKVAKSKKEYSKNIFEERFMSYDTDQVIGGEEGIIQNLMRVTDVLKKRFLNFDETS